MYKVLWIMRWLMPLLCLCSHVIVNTYVTNTCLHKHSDFYWINDSAQSVTCMVVTKVCSNCIIIWCKYIGDRLISTSELRDVYKKGTIPWCCKLDNFKGSQFSTSNLKNETEFLFKVKFFANYMSMLIRIVMLQNTFSKFTTTMSK